jgi:isopropylmalate/homocitrate/citramalate synthase
MIGPEQNEWTYDWNTAAAPLIPPGTRVLLNDETLRDGLQNPSVHDPSIPEKIELLHLMESLSIDSLNIGLPGAGPRAVEHTEALAREIVNQRMKIRPNCAARTIEADIRPIAEISQRVGISAPALSAASSRTGPSIISSAPRKKR